MLRGWEEMLPPCSFSMDLLGDGFLKPATFTPLTHLSMASIDIELVDKDGVFKWENDWARRLTLMCH